MAESKILPYLVIMRFRCLHLTSNFHYLRHKIRIKTPFFDRNKIEKTHRNSSIRICPALTGKVETKLSYPARYGDNKQVR